jgi:putative aldouronate transport system permease protein
VRDFGMMNSRLAIILPIVVNTWNYIILRTSFQHVPDSLIESARIDGGSEWRIVWSIVVPVSKATVAVIALFYAVRMWNEWFNPSLFLTQKNKYPLQLVLREILLKNDTNSMTQVSVIGQTGQDMFRQLVKYCTIMVATIPILIVYPFVQKYFVAGVMIGSIKE